VISALRLGGTRTNRACGCWLVALFTVLCVAACSASLPRVKIDTLGINVATQANLNTPIAVDVVMARNAQLFDTLLGLPAAKWFNERDQLQRDYPKDLSVQTYELVPGQQLPDQPFPFGGQRAAGVLVFAGYQTPGAHRIRIDGGPQKALLLLGDQDLRLVSR
jgi:type VI secretion system protein